MKMTLPAATLQRAVRAVEVAISKNDYRPVLTGILLRYDKATATLTATATDSYRLHIATVDVAADAPGVAAWTAVVPGQWLARWARQAWYEAGGTRRRTLDVTITLSSGRFKLTTGVDERSIPVIRHEFPKLDSLLERLDNTPNAEIGVNPAFFADMVRAADRFAPREALRVQAWHPLKANRFVVEPSDGRLEVLLMPIRLSQREGRRTVAA